MDIEMPVLDGIAATIKLRKLMTSQQSIIPEIPIIALTAYLDEKDNCLRAGMADFSKLLYLKFKLKLILIVVKPTSKGEL